MPLRSAMSRVAALVAVFALVMLSALSRRPKTTRFPSSYPSGRRPGNIPVARRCVGRRSKALSLERWPGHCSLQDSIPPNPGAAGHPSSRGLFNCRFYAIGAAILIEGIDLIANEAFAYESDTYA
jgi:hypothetical protein